MQVVGGVAKLPCIVQGSPISINWKKEGQDSGLSGPRINVLGNGTLQITSLEIEDGGLYTCIASDTILNRPVNDTYTVRLLVRSEGEWRGGGGSAGRVSEGCGDSEGRVSAGEWDRVHKCMGCGACE